jgi:hypothetical protein
MWILDEEREGRKGVAEISGSRINEIVMVRPICTPFAYPNQLFCKMNVKRRKFTTKMR